MFFRFNRRFNLLKLDETFARLVNVSAGGHLTFEFTYNVSQSEAVQRSALTVNVSIVSRTIQRRPLFDDSHHGHINTRQLISNILNQVHDAKTSLKEQETFTVSQRSSDISARINNEIIPQLRAGVSPRLIQSLVTRRLVTRTAAELKQLNDNRPLMQFIAHSSIPPDEIDTQVSSSLELDTRRVMYDMIMRQGIDPSHITRLTHRSIPAQSTMGGLLRRSRAPESAHDPAVRLLHHHVFANRANPFRTTVDQVQDDAVVHVAESVVTDDVEVPIRLTIPRSARYREGADVSHFLVKFDLVDGSTGATIDSVIKPLDVARHIQLFYTPYKPPIVHVGSSEVSSRVNVEVKQVDPGATAIQVYKKSLFRASVEIEDYVLIGTFPLTSRQQSVMVQVEKPLNSTAIYRVVPVGELGNLGFEYTNIVVKPNRYNPIKAIALSARSTEAGVEVEIRQFPTHVVAIQIQARNLTKFEKQYVNIGTPILLDDATRAADYVSFIDDTVSEGRVYEYVAKIVYGSGNSELSGNAIVEFVKQTPGKVDLRITDVEVINDINEPNVTFTMKSIILDENIDVVLALLKRHDIKEYFDNDILREREFLKELVAHNVQRVELDTGKREDFGVVVSDSFDDKELRRNNSVSPLKYGRKYRYEVITLLRTPETMFEKFVKEKVDDVTKKSYKFSPSKFLHPITLRTGTIVTAAGLRSRYTKDPMQHGAIGSTETIEISFDDQPARINNPSAARFNRLLNIITWKLEGSVDQIDHFLITKDVHGVRTLIGKAHSEFEFGNCQYLHPVTSSDEGELKYIITPVFNDYRTGIQAVTNSVIV